jgi:hypothetical protein
MKKYQILKKGFFESHDKFENRINQLAFEGWKASSISHQGTQMVVLMEKL